MRVLHFFKTYLPDTNGGIEQVIRQIIEGCAPLGVSAEVLSLSRDPDRNSVSMGTHFAHKAKLDADIASTGLSLSAMGKFRQLSRSADLIHYHFPWPYMDLVHFSAFLNKPALVTYHSDVVRQKRLRVLYAPLMHAFLSSVDLIVATSPDYAKSSAVLRRYRAKTRIIPIGLNPVGLATPPSDASVTRWRIRLGERFFLFVGALRYYKGLSFLVEAARATGYPVVVAGDGEMRATLAGAGLDNIQLVGQISDEDRSALLQLAIAFIFPSHLRSEAFGVALLEAAFAGKAMISCALGTGTSYVNKHGETGLVIPPADADALAAAMVDLWENPERTARFGAAARKRALCMFTADRMAADYVALYRQLVGGEGLHE